jgi:hypothetical protein
LGHNVVMATTLDYQSGMAGRRANAIAKIVASLVVAMVVVVANSLLLRSAAADQGWGALGIAVMVGPLTNAVIAAVALACIPLVRRLGGGTPVGMYGWWAAILPIGAILFDWVAVSSMSLHGC